jgi:hypothetical protein
MSLRAPKKDAIFGETRRDKLYNSLFSVGPHLERYMLFGSMVCFDCFLVSCLVCQTLHPFLYDCASASRSQLHCENACERGSKQSRASMAHRCWCLFPALSERRRATDPRAALHTSPSRQFQKQAQHDGNRLRCTHVDTCACMNQVCMPACLNVHRRQDVLQTKTT